MSASTIFFLLLVLACQLMMMLMMRGGHGHGGGHAHGGGGHGGHDHQAEPRETSTDDLRRQRDELDRMIEARESSEAERELEPSGSGRR
jgi:Spy/CpxP family protein refolding chaperone